MAERLLGGWGCTGRLESNLGSSGRSSSRLARCHKRCCAVKGLGPAPLTIAGLCLERQTRTSWRRRTIDVERRLRCAPRSVQQEVVPQSSEPTQYTDSWLEVKAVEFLTDRIGFISGKTTELKGYDGFVDMTRRLVHGLPSKQQRDRVRDLLHVVLPGWLVFLFHSVPKTTFVKEFYAQFTTVFFKWLVGDCEVREGEIDGVFIKSTVHIKKCRYLEQSKCVGLCVNLCKSPTQEFITKQFGMPLTMNPNFEDMSCDMIYGLHPSPVEEDVAYQQPCYALCKTIKAKPNCA